jgi:hypothetical protein
VFCVGLYLFVESHKLVERQQIPRVLAIRHTHNTSLIAGHVEMHMVKEWEMVHHDRFFLTLVKDTLLVCRNA